MSVCVSVPPIPMQSSKSRSYKLQISFFTNHLNLKFVFLIFNPFIKWETD